MISEIEIRLPVGKTISFATKHCEWTAQEATCSVIKDAGDDPDCTHGAEITATVSHWEKPGETLLERGFGVAVVTKEGLGLPVGGPSITPVPRKNIIEMVAEGAGEKLKETGFRVVLSVPQGEEMAKKTLNGRLGLVGGISILGTTGIVVPFSTAAYRASIAQEIDVAKAMGLTTIVLTTGGKSEQFAMKILKDLREESFVQMGDFTGFSLQQCARKGVKKAVICGMPGKLSKIATGKMQTHAAGSEVDMEFLAGIASECGAKQEGVIAIRAANTARHVSELVAQFSIIGFFDKVCQKVCEAASKHIAHAMTIESILTDFEGKVLGRFQSQ